MDRLLDDAAEGVRDLPLLLALGLLLLFLPTGGDGLRDLETLDAFLENMSS